MRHLGFRRFASNLAASERTSAVQAAAERKGAPPGGPVLFVFRVSSRRPYVAGIAGYMFIRIDPATGPVTSMGQLPATLATSALGRNKTLCPALERGRRGGALGHMDGGSEKLRSLARQTRALAGTVSSRERAHALQVLARLYEKQAADLEPMKSG